MYGWVPYVLQLALKISQMELRILLPLIWIAIGACLRLSISSCTIALVQSGPKFCFYIMSTASFSVSFLYPRFALVSDWLPFFAWFFPAPGASVGPLPPICCESFAML